jgi:negative regulator of flagellin synthesis FlgM
MSISPLSGQERLRAAKAIAALRSTSASSPAPAPAVVRQADGVSISDAARSLSAAREAITDSSELRHDRVSAIKAAIANGTYKVNSRELADSLIKNFDR